jgi:hypothetical protein
MIVLTLALVLLALGALVIVSIARGIHTPAGPGEMFRHHHR